MLKMSGFDVLFAAAGALYWLFVLLAICLALWIGKTWTRKLIYAAIALALSIAPIAPEIYRTIEYRSKLTTAQALFEERCKTAGEKIYKTVEGVDGVLLMKVRQYDAAQSNPMMAGAAAAHEFYGDDYIRSFLLYEREPSSTSVRSLSQDSSKSTRPGYRYVDVLDPADHKRYRYTLAADTSLNRSEAVGPAPRFGVMFEDEVNPDERKHWVASSTVKVIDLQTQETLGEFIRYVIEPGQGSVAGQRTPWLFANGCNMKTSYGSYSSRLFVDQVLKPIREISK